MPEATNSFIFLYIYSRLTISILKINNAAPGNKNALNMSHCMQAEVINEYQIAYRLVL